MERIVVLHQNRPQASPPRPPLQNKHGKVTYALFRDVSLVLKNSCTANPTWVKKQQLDMPQIPFYTGQHTAVTACTFVFKQFQIFIRRFVLER